ncbi:MAG: hypothetical protein JL56_14665 [Desulfotomaculum sp. BICA1-6]|nr:MAG: hypothetical protein JL56_14665 [Desulfotomaculum sp. BICA1-6]
MARESAMRQVTNKDINWYGSMGVPTGINNVNVVARVEKVRPSLLENSLLRVDVVIRMFTILPENRTQQGAVQKSIEKDIDLVCFVQLRHVEDFKNVVSVQHEIVVDKVSLRMGRVSIVGTLKLEVTYLGYVILEGLVSGFPRNAPVPGALVTVKDAQHQDVLFSTTTGRDGGYIFSELSPGTYRVAVEAEGYRSNEQMAVVMLHDRVNFTLHRL